jgi:ArsR family transcriptional regulator, lead/cadmium/zinc/bismuth-responsive transcriptional repressor
MQTCNDYYINGVIHEDVVKSVKSKLPQDRPIIAVSGLFRVLGDDTRLRIICALGFSEMCVCDIAALLNMSSSAISHQLRILKESKIIKGRREGKAVYYILADEHIEKLFKIAFEHVLEV